MPDILVVDNYHESVVCGDIHGNSERGGLEDVLKSLGPTERLVIVGDLVDRGPDSFGVVKRIIEVNAEQARKGLLPNPKILVARGNHEDEVLECIKKMLEKKSAQERASAAGKHEWLAKLSIEDLQLIQNYFSSLPYIIHVKDAADSFNVVHADLPFSGAELMRRINVGKLDLTESEKRHATWAREDERFDKQFADADEETKSIMLEGIKEGMHDPLTLKSVSPTDYPHLTFSGHTPGGSVRAQTKHFNLDINSHSIQCCLAVRVKEKSFQLIGDQAKINEEKSSQGIVLVKAAKTVATELEDQLKLIRPGIEILRNVIKLNEQNREIKIDEIRKQDPAYFKDEPPIREEEYIKMHAVLTKELKRAERDLTKYPKPEDKRHQIIKQRIEMLKNNIETLDKIHKILPGLLTYSVIKVVLKDMQANMKSSRKNTGWGLMGSLSNFFGEHITGKKVIAGLMKELDKSDKRELSRKLAK